MIRYSLKNPHPELSDPPTVCKVLMAVMREGIGGCGMCLEVAQERAAQTLLVSCRPGNCQWYGLYYCCVSGGRESEQRTPSSSHTARATASSTDCTIAVPLTEDDA